MRRNGLDFEMLILCLVGNVDFGDDGIWKLIK